MSGDCITIAMEDAGSFDAIAFIDSDDDGLSIWMEGLFLDGGIEGSSFVPPGASTATPRPGPPGVARRRGVLRPRRGLRRGDDSGAAPPCAEPYEPEPNPAPGVTVELEGIIAAEDVIHGELNVRMVDDYGSCSFSAEMVGIALDMGDGEPETAEVETGLVEDDGHDTGNIESPPARLARVSPPDRRGLRPHGGGPPGRRRSPSASPGRLRPLSTSRSGRCAILAALRRSGAVPDSLSEVNRTLLAALSLSLLSACGMKKRSFATNTSRSVVSPSWRQHR